MRFALTIAAAALVTSAVSLADEVASTSAPAATPAQGTANQSMWATRSTLVAGYAAELADRPIAIGANRFEASFQGSGSFNDALGFGMVPDLRWGYSDNLEITLLGARYIITEDGFFIPGLAISAKLHDFTYQHNTTLNENYPVLRPSIFLELRDRFSPLPLAATLRAGYVADIQAGNNAPDGTPINTAQRQPLAEAPIDLQLQYSPLQMVSFVGAVGYILDTSVPPITPTAQSEGYFSVAAVYNSSRFDVRIFFQNNWYTNAALGYVPEIGASAAVRL